MTTAPARKPIRLAAGTGSSVVVEDCQVCGHAPLRPVLFLGYLPPVNQMRTIGQTPHEQPAYPAMMLHCPNCQLVQLGLTVDPAILFPPEYPYTSGTTKILRENFAELYADTQNVVKLKPTDLVVDIGSNDGTLLSNFHNAGHRVHGIEPTDMGKLANSRGIKSTIAFFGPESAAKVRQEDGPATIITATNVFAHIENVHQIVESILSLLDDRGVFISESHYLVDLLETLQYDTIYHEHLRYYSLTAIQHLLGMHGLEVIRVKRIPTHGGSIRVYAARQGAYKPDGTVAPILDMERQLAARDWGFAEFRKRVVDSKLGLLTLLKDIRGAGQKVYGIAAPSRASTLVTYVGLDDGTLDCVLEVKGSYKIGKYMPGTIVPVLEESRLFEDQPDYALLLAWHIADELMPKLKAKGFKGKFIVPLPTPRVVG